MKKEVIFIISIFILNVGSVTAQTPVTETVTKLDVYYFHSTYRCVTCRALEAETKETLNIFFQSELHKGIIRLHILNIDDDANTEIVKKYKVWGSSLLLVKPESQEEINLTNLGFAYAHNNPEKFRLILKNQIDRMI